MGSWDEVIRFLVAFGGGRVMLALSMVLFVWILDKLDELG